MRILFISRDYRINKDGGSAVTWRNLSMLKEIADEFVEYQIPTPSLFTRIKNILFSEGYGQTAKIKNDLLKLLDENFDLVFFNSSLYGVYLSMAKKKGKRTCCFYHNVEQKYYKDKFRVDRKLQNLIMIYYVKYCEKLSCKNSDYIITLNERDSKGLMEYYERKTDFIFPTSFESIDYEVLKKSISINNRQPYALFVGSNFFANVEGLKFLFEKVAPYISCYCIIVGSVCKAFEKVKLPSNIILKGYVEDLLPYYSNAICVVSPIFSGSGLKTKTIEALRYGKTFIGSEESFVGIDPKYYEKIGKICTESNEYINAINKAVSDNCYINENSLELFNSQYSSSAQLNRFSKFIKKIVNTN